MHWKDHWTEIGWWRKAVFALDSIKLGFQINYESIKENNAETSEKGNCRRSSDETKALGPITESIRFDC